MKKIILPDSEIYLVNINNFTEHLNLKLFLQKTEFRSDRFKIFGKEFSQPRNVAFYSNKGITYKYSNILMHGKPYFKELLLLKEIVEFYTCYNFNSILINVYRNGHDYMGAHSDNEKELGEEPFIASLSLGASRDFILINKKDKKHKLSLELKTGDLLIMKGKTQAYWNHCLPKRTKVKDYRINLTFRSIYL